MGSSLYLSGGVQSTDQLVKTVSQSNTFAIGDAIRWDIITNSYKKAQADNAINSEVVGVVSAVTATQFTMIMSGAINLTSVGALSGITAPVLFLSGTTAGGLSVTPPSAIGAVIKPILIRNQSSQEYVVNNFLGTQIGGSSTVAIDQIQPVGTIMPYAGAVIPDTWLACSGASYAVADYPELYAKLQNSSGDRVPAYGYVATLTGTNVSSVLSAGDYIQYKTDAGTWTGTGSPFAGAASNAALLATVLSVTSTTAVVQVIPIYSSTTKNFTINNTVFGGGGFVGVETGTGNYRAYTTASAFKAVSLTITGVAITHFNTPDLRGRFAIGSNTSTLPATGDLEGDSANNSAISGIYSIGSEGGQESTIAGTGVATGTNAYVTSAAASGGLIANMPPYTVVRYIIKAKPYTRAAIIDGVDIPYDQLLVRDSISNGLQTELLGGLSGGDLVFYTNSGEASKLGTERMRLSNDGNLIVGINSSIASPNPLLVFGSQYSTSYPINAFLMDPDAPAVGKGGGIAFGGKPSSSSAITSTSGRAGYGAIGGYKENATDADYAGYLSLMTRVSASTSFTERIRITSAGNVGIGTSTPGTSLDVNGRVNFTSASTDFGAANRANLVVGNGVVASSRQLQFGVSDTHNCAWIMGWLNSSGGQTLAIQPLGGRIFMGATASRFSNDPTTAVGIYGDLTMCESNIIMNVDFRTRASSGWARGLLFTDGFSPAQSGSYSGVTGGIGMNGVVTSGVNTPNILYMGWGSTPWGSGKGLYVLTDGRVGAGTIAPAVALDVVGEARSSVSTVYTSNAKTLVTKDYVDGNVVFLNMSDGSPLSVSKIVTLKAGKWVVMYDSILQFADNNNTYTIIQSATITHSSTTPKTQINHSHYYTKSGAGGHGRAINTFRKTTNEITVPTAGTYTLSIGLPSNTAVCTSKGANIVLMYAGA